MGIIDSQSDGIISISNGLVFSIPIFLITSIHLQYRFITIVPKDQYNTCLLFESDNLNN
jgi:hypothetical protein